MLLMLLLLIPLAGIFLISTTMYGDSSPSNIRQIKLKGLVLIIDLEFIMYSVLFFSCYWVIWKMDFVHFSFEFEISLITISLWLILYLMYFDKFLYKQYPRLHKFILLSCVILALFCIINLILKYVFGFDAISWLKSVIYYLNQYWINIKKPKGKKQDSSSNQPNGSNNNPNDNNSSDLTPEEKKRKRKKESNARYREKNREKLREKSKDYWGNNKDKRSEKIKQWQSDNPEKHKAYSKKSYDKWVNNNRETSRALSKQWRDLNPEGVKKNNDISGEKRKAITRENSKDMAQYEGILLENKPMFESWMGLNEDELKDLFKKKRIRKDLQNGFEFFKQNPNYYDDISQDGELFQDED